MALKDSPGSVMSLGFLLWGPALLLFITTMALASGQEFDRGEIGQKLNLDIYLYETGQTLVMGYVENPMSLSFLKPPRYTTEYAARYVPDYKYENDTHQLYAWTDALTMKREETWSLIFLSHGFYEEYQIVFHLPSDLRLGMINSSEGLKYMVSASNDSLIVDVQGYRVHDPSISVEYQQPMVTANDGIGNNDSSSYDGKNGGIGSNVNLGLGQNYLLLILALITAGGVVAVLLVRRKDSPHIPKPPVLKSNTVKLDDADALDGATMPETKEKVTYYKEQPREASALEADLSEDSSEDEAGFFEMPPEVTQLEGTKKEKEKEIAISSEMKAVMDALTHRERSIMEALIKHGGRMTQAEIRYETGLPRSSLTMVLISLERRNLITKKEWGRTNVIELSESFFSKKEQS
jgi:uncharacterized membrane protein